LYGAAGRCGAALDATTIGAVLPVFLVTFPFFALIAAGYAAARARILPLDAIPGLNTFVLYFALPCMLLRFGAGTPIGAAAGRQRRTGLGRLRAGGGGGRGHVHPQCAHRLERRGLRRAGGGVSEHGLHGRAAAGGDAGGAGGRADDHHDRVRPGGDLVAVHRAVAAGRCRECGAGRQGASLAARKALRGILVNPMPWSILLGVLLSAARWQLPGPIERTVAMLADAASPVALFTIGAVLARSALLAREHDASAAVAQAMGTGLQAAPKAPLGRRAAGGGREAAGAPAAGVGPGAGAIALGLPLSHAALVVIVLVAALPSASNVSMLAERFGADNGRIARIILWTTVVAFFSFPLAVGLLR
jgi:malonate transporter